MLLRSVIVASGLIVLLSVWVAAAERPSVGTWASIALDEALQRFQRRFPEGFESSIRAQPIYMAESDAETLGRGIVDSIAQTFEDHGVEFEVIPDDRDERLFMLYRHQGIPGTLRVGVCWTRHLGCGNSVDVVHLIGIRSWTPVPEWVEDQLWEGNQLINRALRRFDEIVDIEYWVDVIDPNRIPPKRDRAR